MRSEARALEFLENHAYKDTPYCHGHTFCTCHAGYLDPDEFCPFHGSYENKKCVKCGRYFSLENPKTCITYKGGEKLFKTPSKEINDVPLDPKEQLYPVT